MTLKDCQADLIAVCLAKFTVVVAACLLVSGCIGATTHNGTENLSAIATTRSASAHVRIEPAMESSRSGCAMRYTHYRPAGARSGDLVVLGHGFLRGEARMAGLALALAEAGVPTVTLDFCNDRLWNGHHIRNGLDMIGLADTLEARRVVYAGFSAGALAALVAGRNDPRTLGVVALDLVDADGLGARMAAGLNRPLIGLVGAPSACNAGNNGLGVYALSNQAVVEHFPSADHCDFESDTDWLCRLFCERTVSASTTVRRDIIRTTVAAVGDLLSTPESPTHPGG